MLVDTSSADAMLTRVTAYVTEGWKDVAAEEAKNVILDLTAQGLDADGNRFHDYSDGHASVRARLGLPTDVKNLNMGILGLHTTAGGLLPSLKPRRRGTSVRLAVSDDPNSKLNKVAHGQMFHPKWSYHHNFLAVGERMLRKVEVAIVHPMRRGIINGLLKLNSAQ